MTLSSGRDSWRTMKNGEFESIGVCFTDSMSSTPRFLTLSRA